MNINGTAKKPPDLAELREERKLVRARLALARDKALLESLALWDSFGGSDLFDRVRPRRNDDGDATRWVPPSVPSDRRHGANWPLWRTHYELDELRQESRLRCAANSHAKGLLANLTNNVINKGFAYKCKPKDPIDVKPAVPGMQDPRDQLAKVAQKVLDRFLRQNNWNGTIDPAGNRTVAGSREREIYRRIKRDGECFLRFHCQPDGSLVVRCIEPEQVRDQGGGLASEGWSFGIRHSMSPYEDVECAEEYSVFWPDASAKGGAGNSDTDEGTYELIDASEVLHLKGPDTDSTIKRGTPAFVYDTGAALDRASKLQRYVSIAASIRAASAEIWQHQTATQTQLQSMSDALAAYQRTDPTTGQSTNVERIGPGAIRRLPAGLELVNPAPDQSASYLEAGQGDLRQAASGECAPEFWLAETSSGNYSNLESAAAPAVRAGQCEQEYYKSAFARVAWQALQAAVRAGKLPRGLEEALVIEVEAPAVLHRNELEKAQEDQIGVEQGWKDRQTCAAERGLVWDTVQKNNEEYEGAQQDQQMQQQVQGQLLGLQGQPGSPGVGGPPQPGGGGPPQPPGGQGQEPPHPPGPGHPPQPGQQHAQPPRPGQKMRMPLAERLEQLEDRYGGWLAGEIAGAAFRLMESKDATGHEHKGPGEGGGQFTAAASAMTTAHPFPGPAPPSPPGMGNPRMLKDNPALAAAARLRDEHMGKYNRAFIAAHVHDLLSGPEPKLQPSPDPAEPLKKLKQRGRRAQEDADTADAALVLMDHAGYARPQAAVADSHPEGKEALAAAREEAKRRQSAAHARLEEYRVAVRQAQSKDVHESKDATGHEHKGKGEGGGQFTGTGGGGGGEGGNEKHQQAVNAVKARLERVYGKNPSDELKFTVGLPDEADPVQHEWAQEALNLLNGDAQGNKTFVPVWHEDSYSTQFWSVGPTGEVDRIAMTIEPREGGRYRIEGLQGKKTLSDETPLETVKDTIARIMMLKRKKGVRESKDATGHEHKGKGESE